MLIIGLNSRKESAEISKHSFDNGSSNKLLTLVFPSWPYNVYEPFNGVP